MTINLDMLLIASTLYHISIRRGSEKSFKKIEKSLGKSARNEKSYGVICEGRDNMKKEELMIDNLASIYLESGCEKTFSELYKLLAKKYEAKVAYWQSSANEVSDHNVTEMFDDAVLKTFKRLKEYESNDFSKLFSTIVHNDFKDLWRKLRTKRKYEMFYEQEDDSGAPILQLVDEDAEIENKFFAAEKKKDTDKENLVNVLIRDCDSLTTAIINEYLKDPDAKPTAIGRKLGVHHSKVTRQLKKLAKKYDERQFGDINAYLIG